MIGDRLLTLEEVAEELRCSVSTVKRRRRAGELAAVVDGRLVTIREAELRRYVLERERRQGRARPGDAPSQALPAGTRLWD